MSDFDTLKKIHLERYNQINQDKKYSCKELDENSSSDDIRNELEYVQGKRQHEQDVETLKRYLILAIDTLCLAGTKTGLSNGWTNTSREMHWRVFREKRYDDAFDELAEKYRNTLQTMPPEWKILKDVAGQVFFNILLENHEKKKKARPFTQYVKDWYPTITLGLLVASTAFNVILLTNFM